jgi:hypothetical protein
MGRITQITASTLAEARKLNHLGITTMPRRSTLSDANARRPEAFFEAVYRDLLASNRHLLSSDSRNGSMPPWLANLLIMDSTTIPLFSNLLFKGVGRNHKTGKKGGTTRLIISGRVPGRHQGPQGHTRRGGRRL